jgi:hypothetical protein
MTQRLLDLSGIGKERLHLEWLSSAEAQRFTEIAKKTVDSIKEIGPLDQDAFAMKLTAAEFTVNAESVRWLVGKELSITTKGDVYGRSWDVTKYEKVLDDALEREYHNNLIILALKDDITSVREISRQTGLEVLRISYLLADLERVGRAEFVGMTDRMPAFAAL